MTDPLDITHVVLMRLSELLRTLPPDLIAELYAGTATLEVVPKGGRPAKKAPVKAEAPVSAAQVGDDLSKIDDRVAATRYIEDLKLTVPQLKMLAKELDISVAGNAKKAEAIHAIVQWTVARRLDSAAISRPSLSRL